MKQPSTSPFREMNFENKKGNPFFEMMWRRVFVLRHMLLSKGNCAGAMSNKTALLSVGFMLRISIFSFVQAFINEDNPSHPALTRTLPAKKYIKSVIHIIFHLKNFAFNIYTFWRNTANFKIFAVYFHNKKFCTKPYDGWRVFNYIAKTVNRNFLVFADACRKSRTKWGFLYVKHIGEKFFCRYGCFVFVFHG